ncbi:hypothetical protein ABPG75_007527 [Micractinium tetrahymenae]
MLQTAAALTALLLAVNWQGTASQSTGQVQGIIRASGGRFVDDACTEYRFAGWNGWNLLHYAVQDRGYVTQKFQAAQAASLNMCRFFLMGGDDDGAPLLLSAPGQVNEQVAQGLDFLLAEAAKYGIKLTLAFLNLWKPGGVPQFEQWCGTASSNFKPHPELDIRPGTSLNESERLQTPYAWLTSSACRQQVKDLMSAVVSRRNSLTGVLYRDDPTIFSWLAMACFLLGRVSAVSPLQNLMNEPRCKYCTAEPVDSWYGEMAAHLKSVDPSHLLTTGEEGFFEEGDPMAAADPNDGNLWALRGGQSFRANHEKAGMDYAVLHLWPDNWRKPPYDVAWGQQWIQAHIQVASELGLPLVLEEFGKNAYEQDVASVRDPWFQMVDTSVQSSLQAGGPLRGALFWQWDGESGPRPGDGSDIRMSDSTFTQHIRPFAKQLAAGPPERVPGCTPRTPPAAAPAASAAVPAMPAAPPNPGPRPPGSGSSIHLFDTPPVSGRRLLGG